MKNHYLFPTSTNLQSNLFAFSITILVLICMLFLQTKQFIQVKHPNIDKDRKKIELKWEIQALEEFEPNSKKFVEANPNSPINLPDEKQNFSFRDQQAAQPLPSMLKTKEMTPKLNGVEFSSKITPSSMESPALKKIPDLPVLKEHTKERQKIAEKIKTAPLPKNTNVVQSESTEQEGLKIEDHENDGQGRIINLSKKRVDNKPDTNEEQISTSRTPNLSSISTRPRPRLSPDLLRGPVMKTVSNAPRVGVLAVECRLHPYGVYVQEMLRSIEDQWHHLAHASLRFLQKDKMKEKITYRFTLKADGTIMDLSFLGNTDGSLPTELCRQAIASRVPFGEWTQKMIEDFGQTDEITIHFNYR